MFPAALFMKPEGGGRECVHLSVICCTLLVHLCHMSFYLAAHQPPKSPGVYIIVVRRADVPQNVLHFSCIHFICGNKTFSLPGGAHDGSVHFPGKNLQPFVSKQKSAKKSLRSMVLL